jgi:two-component system cell cycle response regulator DivK
MKLFGKWRKEPEAKDPFEAAQTAAAALTAPEGTNGTILVVDDNPVVLKAFDLKLKSIGFRVISALDGSSAVSMARQEKPNVIVLDINFPPDVGRTGLQWDGFSIMEWMRRFKEVADIPVIIITSSDPEKYKERAMAAGAVGFFQKPIDHEEFLATVQRVLS